MKLLLVESAPGKATDLSTRLTAEGHEVVHCAADDGGPCRGVAHHDECPLAHHVDLAIVARQPGTTHTLSEMGSVCAARHRVPVVEVDPERTDDELPNVTVAHAVAQRAVLSAYATAVRNELAHLPTVVEVCRVGDGLRVAVQLPASQNNPAAISAAADRARFAIRTYDPFVSTIDVAVSCHPD